MNAESAMDEVTDLIANIEMHRQEIEKETGLDAARNYALGRLQLALHGEQEGSLLNGASDARLAISNALAVEIRRVEALAGTSSRRPVLTRASSGPPPDSRRDAQRKSPASRGRRTMGRRSGR
jgi:hypothetical protein